MDSPLTPPAASRPTAPSESSDDDSHDVVAAPVGVGGPPSSGPGPTSATLGQYIGAAVGVGGILAVAAGTAGLTLRSARAGRARINAARAEFI
ncbi:hypothetical protein nbrc107696_05390 [Gordonia spumicola]|uniref:Uncharacterized protein n=1 Tax=Gordonia spumicola TaxID=589161 RepID=A0A7I9V4H7_9ACTN|nr:hypothetical protein [Gordonia spumicola]GEE00093.1 hypothetical protein nbrc107696_05390 [Gordonia spumicola]